jgi:hypothetical protein
MTFPHVVPPISSIAILSLTLVAPLYLARNTVSFPFAIGRLCRSAPLVSNTVHLRVHANEISIHYYYIHLSVTAQLLYRERYMNRKGQFQFFFLLFATREFRPAQRRCRTTRELERKPVSMKYHPLRVKQTDGRIDRTRPLPGIGRYARVSGVVRLDS